MKISPVKVEYDEVILNQEVLEFQDGKLNIVIGESGSGKSSLLTYMYMGMKEHYPIIEWQDQHFDGNQLSHRQQIRQYLITYIPQERAFIESLSCADNLKTVGRMAGNVLSDEEVKDIMGTVGLEIDPSLYPGQLSGGEKCKLSFALALVRDSPIILCDEITASLDLQATEDIIELMKELVNKHHKTIICATHSKKVAENGDCLYEISDKTIKPRKVTEEKPYPDKTDYSRTNRFGYLSYLVKKNNRYFVKNLIYMLVVSLISSILCLGIQYGHQIQNVIDTYRNYSVRNEYYLTHIKGDDKGSAFHYMEEYYGFDDNQNQKIAETLEGTAYYPFFSFDIHCDFNDTTYFELYKDGKQIFEDNEVNAKLEDYQVYVFPYYNEQNYDQLCQSLSPDTEGVYITSDLALMYGIEDTDDMTIKMKVGVPSYSKPINVRTDTGIPLEYKENINEYVELEVPVRGILSRHMNLVLGTTNVYMNYTQMSQILDQHKATDIPEDGFPYAYSTYIVFTNENEDIAALTEKLETLDSNFMFSSINDYLSVMEMEDLPTEKVIRNFIYFSFVLMICLSFGYGIFYKKQESQEHEVLAFYGLNKKKQLILCFIQFIVFWMLISLLSSAITLIVGTILIKKYILIHLFTYTTLIIRCIAISLIFVLCHHLPLFNEVRKYD